MTLSYPPPNSRWRGDGLSGFREILVLPYWDEDFIFFAPTSEGWKEFFLTYSLPLEVFHRVYSPCPEPPPEENSSSKTASLWRQLSSSIARWFSKGK